MDKKELNAKTLEFLKQVLENDDNHLVVAIFVNTETGYNQVVGYGVSIPLLEDACSVSLESLKAEYEQQQKRKA